MATNDNATSGIGFAGALTLLFIGLKLGHVIAWSWWWVLSPLWISTGLFVVIAALLLLIAFVTVTIKERRASR